MSWIRILQPKVIKAIPKGRSPNYATVNKQQIADKIPLFKDAGLAKGEITFAKNPVSETRLYWRSYGSYTSRPVYKRRKKRDLYDKFWDATPSKKNIRVMAQAIKEDTALHGSVFSGRSVTKNKPYASIQLATKLCNMSRDFLEKLWDADAKSKAKRKQRFIEQAIKEETALHGSVFSGKNEPYASRQLATEPLESSTPEEAWIAPLLSRANLLITRDIEWANLTLGFEQANKYAIVDVNNPHEPAGFIREESNVIMRQLLRLRRPFVATITDGYGNELFRVRRPFWWITSSIYAEVGGKEIGVVHRRWHLWRRVYDLYLGDEQFAVVENPGFWNWTFTLKGANGEVLGEIDRDWRGFGFEVLTDAGQYVIRFESAATSGLSEKAGEFEVARPLTLSERAVTVALAVSLDNDYFSRHGGWGLPFIAVAE